MVFFGQQAMINLGNMDFGGHLPVTRFVGDYLLGVSRPILSCAETSKNTLFWSVNICANDVCLSVFNSFSRNVIV